MVAIENVVVVVVGSLFFFWSGVCMKRNETKQWVVFVVGLLLEQRFASRGQVRRGCCESPRVRLLLWSAVVVRGS